VGAGGGDLEGAAGRLLAADVGEILDRRDGRVGWRAGAAQVGPADQPVADLAQRGRAGDPQVRDEGGLDQVGLGTTSSRAPDRRAARAAGSTPLTDRTSPPRPSSPIAQRPSRAAGGTDPAAASRPMAMGRSNPEPCLGRSAGGSDTVMRRSGHS